MSVPRAGMFFKSLCLCVSVVKSVQFGNKCALSSRESAFCETRDPGEPREVEALVRRLSRTPKSRAQRGTQSRARLASFDNQKPEKIGSSPLPIFIATLQLGIGTKL
jgi:hypothetical protein